MRLTTRASAEWLPLIVKLGCVVLLIVTANIGAGWIADAVRFEIRPSNEATVHSAIMISTAAYTFLMAMPFVPGMEVGLGLIGVLGPQIVPLVYLATLTGLAISFVIGRLVPLGGLLRVLDELQFNRASRLLRTVEPMEMEERLAFLLARTPNRLLPFLLRHRYAALVIALNLPGNFLIGGGGGIALVAGVSRLYSAPGFLVTVAIAVSPIPLAILLFGYVP